MALTGEVIPQQTSKNIITFTFWLPLPTLDDSESQKVGKSNPGPQQVRPPAMASTHKKVTIRKLDRDTLNGYVSTEFVVDGKLEMLNTGGNLVSIDLKDIKCVYFVRDFGDADELNRKTFTTRPRTEGLWVRLRFKDNDVLEGMMANDLTQISSDGYLINPPDTRSNTQRIYVPRTALLGLTVLAVIGGPAGRKRKPGEKPLDSRQVPMFTEMQGG